MRQVLSSSHCFGEGSWRGQQQGGCTRAPTSTGYLSFSCEGRNLFVLQVHLNTAVPARKQEAILSVFTKSTRYHVPKRSEQLGEWTLAEFPLAGWP